MGPSEPLAAPAAAPAPDCEREWREYALTWLRQQLGDRAPTTMGIPTYFDASALEGDGPIAIFPFSTSGDEPAEHWVVVGRTEPNYYPRWGLTADEAFRVHLGTRFMLVVGVSQADEAERQTYDPRADLDRILAQIYPGEPSLKASLAAMFRVGAKRHTVCRCRIGGEDVFVMAGDCPPGFYRRTELPPHVVYRLHLGSLLVQEAKDKD